MNPSNSSTVLIFGATGDLTARKLIPAMYVLRRKGFLSEATRIVGVARRDWSDDEFRTRMQEAVQLRGDESTDDGLWESFASQLHYQRVDLTQPSDFEALATRLETLEPEGQAHTRMPICLRHHLCLMTA